MIAEQKPMARYSAPAGDRRSVLRASSFRYRGRGQARRLVRTMSSLAPKTAATTVNREPLANSPLMQAEIVTIRNLGPEGVPFVSGPHAAALIPLSGALYLEWDSGVVWMDLNQVVLVPRGMTLRQRHAVVGDVVYMSVSCPPGPPGRSGECSVLPISADLQREATRLAAMISWRDALPSAIREKALRVILDHVAAMEPPLRFTARGERSLTLVQRVRELVQETSTPRSLKDLAASVGASPVYLTSLFRQIEGMPIYRYQARLRLARSLHSLSETDDITTVAMDLGFANHSHFTTAFKAAFGLTPSAYRASLTVG